MILPSDFLFIAWRVSGRISLDGRYVGRRRGWDGMGWDGMGLEFPTGGGRVRQVWHAMVGRY